MEMRGGLCSLRSAKNIFAVTLSTSITPVSLYTCRHSLNLLLAAVIEHAWRCTRRLRSSELRDTLVDRNRACLEMHLETMRSSQLR